MKNSTKQWIRWAAWGLVLILLNSAASTLFFRADLTKNKVHSLSSASADAVSRLEEPLTIKVYLSANLPAPYNNLEQEMADLLEAYGLRGNKFFNYSLNIIQTEDADEPETSRAHRTDAQSYGIYPIQIQKVEADEVQLVNAFMGMVFIQGDLIETIPVLTETANREFTITSTIRKMSDKTGAILALEEDIELFLYLSGSLESSSPELGGYGRVLASAVEELNRQYYGRLTFRRVDPENPAAGDLPPESYNLPAINLQTGSRTAPVNRRVYAGLVVQNGEARRAVSLLNRGLFGYQIEDPAALAGALPGVIDTLVGINPRIGYVTDHGTPSLYGDGQDPNAPGLNSFRSLAGRYYDLVPVSLEEGIPEDISSLLVVSPREGFTEWELYQLDQFVLQGNAVAYFIDSMHEVIPQDQNQYYSQPPFYLPRNTGLEPLLAHYGITVKNSYILDENCFIQTTRAQGGGYNEVPIYFAPMIGPETISQKSAVTSGIKGMILLNASPLTLAEETGAGPAPELLLSSSADSWEMKENINLYNPMNIFPAPREDRLTQPVAALVQGSMTSYFKDKPLPVPPPRETGEETPESEGEAYRYDPETVLRESGSGRVFVTGSSTLLMDNVLDGAGTSPNATFLLNLLDSLNGREDYARMRSKGLSYNPLEESSAALKSFVKGFNMAGLPLLVVVFGIFTWLRYLARKKRIEALFNGEEK